MDGTILVFDELLHYPGWEKNEALALWEWLEGGKAEYGCETMAVRWVCCKDRVMSLEECKHGGGVKHHRQMIAQGYDQAAAAMVKVVK